jgi:hypothetical protein
VPDHQHRHVTGGVLDQQVDSASAAAAWITRQCGAPDVLRAHLHRGERHAFAVRAAHVRSARHLEEVRADDPAERVRHRATVARRVRFPLFRSRIRRRLGGVAHFRIVFEVHPPPTTSDHAGV